MTAIRLVLPALGDFDAVSILPFAFLVLDIVQVAKNVGLDHLIEIAEPRKILRLMNCNYQSGFSIIYGKSSYDRKNISHSMQIIKLCDIID